MKSTNQSLYTHFLGENYSGPGFFSAGFFNPKRFSDLGVFNDIRNTNTCIREVFNMYIRVF